MNCTHCNRYIPDDLVASWDGSGCPLADPCVPSLGYLSPELAWPRDDDDDDDGESVSREPMLSGGA
jgi:hypothetical protein